jgi:hypothetical protein
MMLEHTGLPLKRKTTAAWSDNTPTLGWVWRMAKNNQTYLVSSSEDSVYYIE